MEPTYLFFWLFLYPMDELLYWIFWNTIKVESWKVILSYCVYEQLTYQEMCAITAQHWWAGSALAIPFWLPVFHLLKYFTLKHKTKQFITQCFKNKVTPNIVEKLYRKEKCLKEMVTFMQTRLLKYDAIPHTLARSKDHCPRSAICDCRHNNIYTLNVAQQHGTGEI